MELRFSGQFTRDIAHCNREVSREINRAITNVNHASSVSHIQNLVKLRKYKVHYRIQVSRDYRIGIIVRGSTVWFSRFGHRSIFYKKLFP